MFSESDRQVIAVLNEDNLDWFKNVRDFSNLKKYECYEVTIEPYPCILSDDVYFNYLLENVPKGWEGILGLDWYVFAEVRYREDYVMDAFGLDKEDRWYRNIDGGTFLLAQSLDDINDLWTVRCTTCLEIHIVKLLDDLEQEKLEALTRVNPQTLDFFRALD